MLSCCWGRMKRAGEDGGAHLQTPTKLNPHPTLALTLHLFLFEMYGNTCLCSRSTQLLSLSLGLWGSSILEILGLLLCFLKAWKQSWLKLYLVFQRWNWKKATKVQPLHLFNATSGRTEDTSSFFKSRKLLSQKFFEHLPLRVIGPNQGMCPFLNNLRVQRTGWLLDLSGPTPGAGGGVRLPWNTQAVWGRIELHKTR